MTNNELLKKLANTKNKGVRAEIRLQLLGFNKPDHINENARADEYADLYKNNKGYQVKSHKATFGLCGYELTGDLITDINELMKRDAADEILIYANWKNERKIYYFTKERFIEMVITVDKITWYDRDSRSKKKSLRLRVNKRRKPHYENYCYRVEDDDLNL